MGGQGNTGTDAVAVGRPGVTVTVGLAVAVTLGVTAGVTVAVTDGDGSGAGNTGSRKPLSDDWLAGGANGEAGTAARTAVMYADHMAAGRLPPVT